MRYFFLGWQKYGLLTLLSVVMLNCEQVDPNYPVAAANAAYFHQSVKRLTDVIVHNIFSPPVASRIYAYPSIAAYECMIHDHPAYQTLAGQVRDLPSIPKPEEGLEYCFPLASIHAYLTVGKDLIFTEDFITSFQEEMYGNFRKMKMPSAVFERSIAYGDVVATHILDWAGKDNYKETRTFPKFSVNDDPGRWQPTPPDYMSGIEPHWRDIRPFVIDSAQQFTPPPPTPYDLDKSSLFYRETMEVYHALNADDADDRIAIAKFWDCNPYVSHHQGHVMYATKKITPGGHWVGITKIACEKDSANLMKTVEAYTLTAIALADAFISCWDEKYRSNLIRPETGH